MNCLKGQVLIICPFFIILSVLQERIYMKTKFESDLADRISAGQSLYMVETTDLHNLQNTILSVCRKSGFSLLRWGPSSGLECLYYIDKAMKNPDGTFGNMPSVETGFNANERNKTCDPQAFSERIVQDTHNAGTDISGKIPCRCVILVEFFESFLQHPGILQNMVDAAAFKSLQSSGVRIIFTGPTIKLPSELLRYVIPLSFELPNEEELLEILKGVRDSSLRKITKQGKAETKAVMKASWICNDAVWPILAQHLKGLSELDAQSATYYAASKYWKDTGIENVLQLVSEYKMLAIERSKVLRYIPYQDQTNENEIGGFGNFLKFIKLRARAYTKAARTLHIDRPKGVALLGLPGTGKSLAAKALGKMLKLPVIVLDIGSLFGSLVGESETRVRDALRVIDGVDGCVLFIDEADKAFAGNNQSSSGDSGTSQRVFGSILNWLQDHKSTTFVVITLNRADVLPPEFLRAGRFDKLFYTDLPTSKERREIIELHFKKRDCTVDFTDDEWFQICTASENFVGAELEEAVKESRLVAFNSRSTGVPTAEELIQCCKERTPMIVVDSDSRLKSILDFCKKRASPVSDRDIQADPVILKSSDDLDNIIFKE